MRIIFLAVALTACGTPTGERVVFAGTDGLPIYSAAQPVPDGAVEVGTVAGLSCKQYAWHPKPSRDAAMADLRIQAAAMNADAVVGVEEAKRGVGLVNNCWSSVEVVGTAVRLP